MKPLDEMSIGCRIAITVLIVLVILFALALFGYLTGQRDQAEAQAQSAPNPQSMFDGEIILLDRIALDSAYRAQMGILFGTWLKDPQFGPKHAMTGARWARQAYIDVRNALDKREAEFRAKYGAIEKQCKC